MFKFKLNPVNPPFSLFVLLLYLCPTATTFVVVAVQIMTDCLSRCGPVCPLDLARLCEASVEVWTLTVGCRQGSVIAHGATLAAIPLFSFKQPFVQTVLGFTAKRSRVFRDLIPNRYRLYIF